MNVILKRIILIVSASLLMLMVKAQVNFSATISPAQINKDEYATLRLMVENTGDIKNFSLPALNDFIIISGPNQESGMSSVNGKVDQYIAISYVLQPRKPGKINIGNASAVIAGKVYKSNTLTILVQNKTSGNSLSNSQAGNPFAGMDPFEENRSSADFNDYILHKGEDVAAKVSHNMQLRLQTDKTSCFVGEPIVASYKLYTRLKSESKLAKNPSFNGFSVIDLQQPDVSAYARETLNGREYNVYTIRKAQLYPLQAGPVELETATLDNKIDFVKEGHGGQGNMNGLLDGFGMNPDDIVSQSVSLSSKPLVINVKPLPEAGKPASFKGAVGDFKVEWKLAKNNFSTDETGTLAIKISGNGNLQLITAPDISWPAGIEAFEPKLADNLINTTVPVSGNKVFQFSFAVQKEGSYVLPALSFSFFDPKTVSYKTASTEPISFGVTKGTGINVSTANAPAVEKDKVSFLNSLFAYRWWIIIFIALIMIASLIYWVGKDKNAAPEKDIVSLQKKADEKMETIIAASAINQQNPLEQTEACLYRQDCLEFYILLNREMKTYLAYKFSLNIAEINAKNITVAMDKFSMDNTMALQLQQLMQDIEWQVYTPFEQTEKRNEIYSRSQALIQLINTYAAVTL
ncbi:MAG: BatD family protein [Ferruginibacter sp.]